jgi:hypothetical protein
MTCVAYFCTLNHRHRWIKFSRYSQPSELSCVFCHGRARS